MSKTTCAKCGTDEFVTINTPKPVNVNTVDSNKKIIIIADGSETVKESAGSDATKITVCAKCGDVIFG